MRDKVVINTGKYKGKEGLFNHWTKEHLLSSKRRASISHQTGIGWIVLLINEGNFTFIDKNT